MNKHGGINREAATINAEWMRDLGRSPETALEIEQAAIIRELKSQPADGVVVPMGSLLQRIMSRLTDMLDDDKFNEIDGMVRDAGYEPPISQPADGVVVPEGCTVADAQALRKANHELAESKYRLRTALRFYANKHHFDVSGNPEAWDTVSGEPPNYWCDEAGTATIEDGTIARMALRGQALEWEDEFLMFIEGEPEHDIALLAAEQEPADGVGLDSRAKMVCDALNQREEISAPREKSPIMMRAALIAKSERIRLRNEAKIARAEHRDVTAGLLLAKAETADAIYCAICEAHADQSNEASITRDAERLSETIAYAVRNDQGYWCGIWSDRDLAESIVAKGQPSHHEKVVVLRVVEE